MISVSHINSLTNLQQSSTITNSHHHNDTTVKQGKIPGAEVVMLTTCIRASSQWRKRLSRTYHPLYPPAVRLIWYKQLHHALQRFSPQSSAMFIDDAPFCWCCLATNSPTTQRLHYSAATLPKACQHRRSGYSFNCEMPSMKHITWIKRTLADEVRVTTEDKTIDGGLKQALYCSFAKPTVKHKYRKSIENTITCKNVKSYVNSIIAFIPFDQLP